MSIKQNLFAALFLCTLTGHAFAATEIHKPDNNLEQLSKRKRKSYKPAITTSVLSPVKIISTPL